MVLSLSLLMLVNWLIDVNCNLRSSMDGLSQNLDPHYIPWFILHASLRQTWNETSAARIYQSVFLIIIQL